MNPLLRDFCHVLCHVIVNAVSPPSKAGTGVLAALCYPSASDAEQKSRKLLSEPPAGQFQCLCVSLFGSPPIIAFVAHTIGRKLLNESSPCNALASLWLNCSPRSTVPVMPLAASKAELAMPMLGFDKAP